MNEIIHEADRLEAKGNSLGLFLRWYRLTIYEHVLQYDYYAYSLSSGGGPFGECDEGDGDGGGAVGMGPSGPSHTYENRYRNRTGNGYGDGIDANHWNRFGMGYGEDSGDGVGAGSPLSPHDFRFEESAWWRVLSLNSGFIRVPIQWRQTRGQGG